MRVLMAEDDLTSRTILRAMLSRWGFEPVPVNDGHAAWAVLRRPDAPRLVILDWNMPGMDGLEVCRRVREAEVSDPPYIIILTSEGEKRSIVTGLEAGANDYITKPYDAEELRARIKVGERMLDLQADLNAAKSALAHEATHDALTGVLNRRAVLGCLEKELARARRQETPVSVAICDIDHFKRVNDRYGHQVGDQVLCGFSAVLESGIRAYDVLGRYGGEEFVIVAPGARDASEEPLYERLCARVAATPIATRAGEVAITVSIGVATATGDGTVDKMLEAADSALYRAKEEGRNRVCHAATPAGIPADAALTPRNAA